MTRVTRRGFVRAAGGALAASALGGQGRAEAEGRRNLLFLMTDQHHHGVLGCAGNPLVQTPNLDRLAAEGVRFTQAICSTPYCSPTRSSLVTGQYPHTTGVFRNVQGGRGTAGDTLRFVEPRVTSHHLLAERGYHCHQLGKWHLGSPSELSCYPQGDEDDELPRQRMREAIRADAPDCYDAGPRADEVLVGDVFMTREMAPAHEAWKAIENRSPQDLSVIGRMRLKPEYTYESRLADYCIELMRRHKDEPFAITYSVSPPHAFWVAPARFYDLYDPAAFELPASWEDRPEVWAGSQPARMVEALGEANVREYLRCYYAQVTMVDWCVGRVLAALDELGLRDSTLVLFTSDHGDMQGAHGMMGKSVGAFYEEICRVPLIMRLPGAIRAGTVCEVQAQSVDVPPTLLDYLGSGPVPGTQGETLRPFIEGRRTGPRPGFGERGAADGRSCGRMLRTADWKLNLYGTGHRELYHLATDPHEMRNLAAEPGYGAIVRRMTDRLRRHLEATADPALHTLLG